MRKENGARKLSSLRVCIFLNSGRGEDENHKEITQYDSTFKVHPN